MSDNFEKNVKNLHLDPDPDSDPDLEPDTHPIYIHGHQNVLP